MKYCTSCGTKNWDSAKFCTTCGAKSEAPLENVVPLPGDCEPAKAERAVIKVSPGQALPRSIDRLGEPVAAAALTFDYVALVKGGERVSGTVAAADKVGAIRAVERLGYAPISVVAQDKPASSVSAETTPAIGDDCPPISGAASTAPGERFEMVWRDGKIVEFETPASLRECILQSRLERETKVRKIVVDQEGKRTESAWTTLERLDTSNPPLDDLYRPVRHWSLKFMGYGAIGGIILKGLDTTVGLFMVNEKIGFVWLVILISLALSKKWPMAPLFGILVALRSGISGNIFGAISMLSSAVFMTILVGAIFGSLTGTVIGTIVGHFKAQSMPRAPDAITEGWRPYQLGILVPVAALTVLVPLYIWFNMKMLQN